jgi:hypothetical protein
VLEEDKTDTMEGLTAPWFKVKTPDRTEGWTFSGFLTAAAPEQPQQESAAGVKKETAAAQKPAVLAPESDFEVTLNKAGDGAVIDKYTGPGGNIIIPATIQDMPVVSVDMNPPTRKAGTGQYRTNDYGEKTEVMRTVNTSLISVMIHEGVRWVARFKDCIALRSVTLPDSVTEIGNGAFRGCTSLASVTIPDGVTTIRYRAFSHCTNLVTVTISPIKRKWEYYDTFSNCPKFSLASQAALKAAGYTGGF